jgi:sterol desaturase/sphingolipid hydroxylase (fatty acid hydroxylase superfamily)
MSQEIEFGARESRPTWQPPEPIQIPPIFVWPPRPLGVLKSLFGFPGYLWPWNTLYAGIALLTWLFLTPDFTKLKTFGVGWIATIFFRNLALIVLLVGAWHLRLYVRRAQGTDYKYNGRWPATHNPNFLFNDQVLDNFFWTVASAVPIWTLYEVLSLWAQANGYIPVVSWQAHPVYCSLLMFIIPMFSGEIHFYVTHRLIHWRPLYRTVHYLHHSNVNVGPWSGLAMHPVEHLVYFSSVLLHWVVPSHPLHVLFHLQWMAFSPSQGHSGFGRIALNDQTSVNNDHYTHYLHHKYFEVNYGAEQFIPMDKWFGTFHDGSEEAQEAMTKRLRRRSNKASHA